MSPVYAFVSPVSTGLQWGNRRFATCYMDEQLSRRARVGFCGFVVVLSGVGRGAWEGVFGLRRHSTFHLLLILEGVCRAVDVDANFW